VTGLEKRGGVWEHAYINGYFNKGQKTSTTGETFESRKGETSKPVPSLSPRRTNGEEEIAKKKKKNKKKKKKKKKNKAGIKFKKNRITERLPPGGIKIQDIKVVGR